MGNYRNDKKAKVLEKNKRNRLLKVILPSIAAAGILALSITLFARAEDRKQNTTPLSDLPTIGGSARTSSRGGQYTEVTPVGGIVTFDAADFSGGTAAYFTTEAAGKTINFFVLESSDGVVRAAFDACDVCYQAKKGYRQAGDLMVCNNCGQQFPSVRINVEKGGCNPSPLERHHEDGKVTIAVADIAKGAMYF
jgi:hypothetical protein